MRLKELRGLPIVDPGAARKVGTVADYLVDTTAGRIAALDVSTAAGGTERIPAARIRRVGRHAVVLTGRAAPAGQPQADERWLDTGSLADLEVLGDDGNRVGRLMDATFDQDSLDVTAYLLRVGPLARLVRRRARVAPGSVAACSRELMIVTTGRVEEQPALARPEPPAPSLGVPLKLEDRLPAPAPRLAEKQDGHALPALRRD